VLHALRPDTGLEFDASYNGCPIYDEAGRLAFAFITIREITAQRKAEMALRESEERFRVAQELSPDGFTILRPVRDAQGHIVDFTWVYENATIARINGTDQKAVVGCRLLELLPGHEGSPILEAYIQVAETGEPRVLEASYQGDSIRTITWFRLAVVPIEGDIAILAQDITARKQDEEALRQQSEAALRLSEQEFHSLAEAMPQIVWATRPDGWNIYFNQQWVEYTGMTMEESYGHGWNKPFHPDDKQRAWDAWQRATQHNERYSLECRLRRADGVYRWWLIRGEPMRGANGEILKWFGTCTDIEEIKRAETLLHEANALLEQRVAERTAALRQSEALYRSIGESIDYGVWVCAADGRNTYASKSFLNMVGITQEQCSNFGWGDVLHPDDAERTIAAWQECVRTGGNWDIEHRFRGVDGQWHHVLARGVPVRNEQGEIISWAGINLDISRLKQAEESLRETTDYLENLFNYANAPIIVWDSSLRVTRFNHAFERLTGLNADEVMGKQLDILFPDKSRDESMRLIENALSGDRWETVEIPILHTDGSVCTVLWNSANILDKNNTKVVATIAQGQDITKRKRAEEELRQAKVTAEAANSAKSQFLANMSHELRTPMTGVLGMLEFTLNTTLDAQQQDFIETAHKSAHTLLRILNDILDLAKVEAGKLSIEEKPFVLHDCVSAAIDILVPEARRKGLELNCTIADDLPKTVVGDQVRLLQVLTNLLGNSVKYTERGEVNITVTAGSQAPEGKREIKFMVTDTGIGIPANKKELIFQSFTQADESHTRKYGGVGLGLAICKDLVERMGGVISCVSEEGVGSTFLFTLPLAEGLHKNEATAKLVTPEMSQREFSLTEGCRNARLLLAEDDPITRKVIGMMLQRSNFDLDMAENGLQAVDMWEKGNYDLVLMDVQMPGQDGFAATRAIREKEQTNGGHTLIVAMTAHAFAEDEKRCLAAGMDAYIPKPIDMKECIALIENLIGKRDLEG
jgi:PAS domain S-box-containing protein